MITTQQQYEERWDDYFAKDDAIRERYACQIEDARREELIYQEEQEYYTRVWNAGYGTDFEAYEDAWKRVFEYAATGAVDDLIHGP